MVTDAQPPGLLPPLPLGTVIADPGPAMPPPLRFPTDRHAEVQSRVSASPAMLAHSVAPAAGAERLLGFLDITRDASYDRLVLGVWGSQRPDRLE